MTIVRMLPLALALLLAPHAFVLAQRPDDLYQQALRKERAEGDLEGAIKLYKQVADANDRALAARALVKIGEAYERLGKTGAESAYQRVVAQFADQQESARAARARLQVLTGPNGVRADAAQTMVFSDLPSVRPAQNAQFDFSPAGDRIVYVGGNDLLVTNSGGTVTRTLLPADSGVYRFSPRWSPDGKYIAFVQRSRYFADTLTNSIMVMPAEGGPVRSLIKLTGPGENLWGPGRGGLIWTNDSRALTMAVRSGTPPQVQDHLVTVDLTGRKLREVPKFTAHLSQMTGYSPDGRWMAFQEPNRDSDNREAMDVWLFPTEGGRAIQITHAPGFDGWPTWTPDGRGLYFVSDRSGSLNIWRVAIDPASGLANGEPTRVTSYTDVSILFPKVVDGGKRVAFALLRETSAIHVAAVDRPNEARALARGGNPVLAPDGRTVFYRDRTSDSPGIFAVSTDGGEPRRVTAAVPNGPAVQTFVLSPDGSQVATLSQSGGDKILAVTPASGGSSRELVRFPSRLAVVAAWSPDGSRLAYAHGNSMFVIPAAGGAASQIARAYAWEGWTVRWSPDGDHIAALGWTVPNQSVAIFVVPSTGGEPRRLTPESESGYKEGLEWHPDGQRLSYMSYGDDERGDGSRVAYLDGRPTTPLVNQPAPIWDYVGRWHPNGTTYYFIAAASVANRWSLFAHDTGARTTRLVWTRDDEPGASVPAFSLDGRVMTFDHRRTTRQLWTIDTNR